MAIFTVVTWSLIMIRIENLSKSFKMRSGLFGKDILIIHALEQINMTINEGEIVGLVGESGSGKTTLANIILNLLKIERGSVIVNGINVFQAKKTELKKLRREVAVVFQDPASNLNPSQKVKNSIMRPLRIHGYSKKEALKKAEIVMEKVQLSNELLNCYPHQLSGGQQQRIAIARALILEPKILILDEPTSALDISIQAQILNLLLDLRDEQNLTYLIISHDLNVIRYLSDKIYVMYLGKIVEYGKTESVFGSPAHPYTNGLLASAPVLNPRHRETKQIEISDEPGSILHINTGCRLSNRCSRSSEICFKEQPPFKKTDDGHYYACFHYKI